jgi:type IV pilus assembly protein PilB
LRVRLRVDGILHEIPAPPLKLHPSIVARIKVLSDMDIAETRRPQDGHFKLKIAGNTIEFRVSTLPTIYGENVVLRVLNSAAATVDLKQLGLGDHDLGRYKKLLAMPHGMLLVTGPTGSGKTTTLYATLARINSPDKKIITVEDPVEYRQPYVRQVQVNPVAGLTFATGLRSILRQDPDVVMVGEIRDAETAQIAVQASLTGHMVFSTLHTNDAPTAVVRLREMDVASYLISSSVTAVLAQRLARKTCPDCKASYTPASGLLRALEVNAEGADFQKGEGCKKCHGTGYRGRVGLYQLMVMSDPLRELTTNGASAEVLSLTAIEEGMRELHQDGVAKACRGETTLEEVLRTVGHASLIEEDMETAASAS